MKGSKQLIIDMLILVADGRHAAKSRHTLLDKATCSAFDMCYEVKEVDEEFENYGPNLWVAKYA